MLREIIRILLVVWVHLRRSVLSMDLRNARHLDIDLTAAAALITAQH